MNIHCPNCETVFELPKRENSNKKYKCSVCNHVWIDKTDKYEKIKNSYNADKANLKKVLILNIIIFLLSLLVVVIFRNYLENIDSNWENVYRFFDILIPVQ